MEGPGQCEDDMCMGTRTRIVQVSQVLNEVNASDNTSLDSRTLVILQCAFKQNTDKVSSKPFNPD